MKILLSDILPAKVLVLSNPGLSISLICFCRPVILEGSIRTSSEVKKENIFHFERLDMGRYNMLHEIIMHAKVLVLTNPGLSIS